MFENFGLSIQDTTAAESVLPGQLIEAVDSNMMHQSYVPHHS